LLSQRIKCARMKSWCLEMIKECLSISSMRLGVPFIALRQLGAVGGNQGSQYLPSVEWRTGQSGVPPNRHCSVSGADCLPKMAQPTVEDLEPLAHRTLSGAPSDRWLSHASHAYCATDRWLCRPLAHRTIRCATGQSGDF
jgi:hypothetical protein